jgi:hypothetical protein
MIVNLRGKQNGTPNKFEFNKKLDIGSIAVKSFSTGSPPVPHPKRAYNIYTEQYNTITKHTTRLANFMTLKDLFASALGRKDITLTISTDGQTQQLVYAKTTEPIPVYCEKELASMYQCPYAKEYQGVKLYSMTCTTNKLVNLRASALHEPTLVVYLRNSTSGFNTRQVRSEEGLKTQLILAVIPVTGNEPIHYQPNNPIVVPLKEDKTELDIDIRWQSDEMFFSEASEYYLTLEIHRKTAFSYDPFADVRLKET